MGFAIEVNGLDIGGGTHLRRPSADEVILAGLDDAASAFFSRATTDLGFKLRVRADESGPPTAPLSSEGVKVRMFSAAGQLNGSREVVLVLPPKAAPKP